MKKIIIALLLTLSLSFSCKEKEIQPKNEIYNVSYEVTSDAPIKAFLTYAFYEKNEFLNTVNDTIVTTPFETSFKVIKDVNLILTFMPFDDENKTTLTGRIIINGKIVKEKNTLSGDVINYIIK